MCHLREFFIVHHMREKEDKRTHQITIPFFKAQESVLDLTNNKQPHEILVEEVKGIINNTQQFSKIRKKVQKKIREINFFLHF